MRSLILPILLLLFVPFANAATWNVATNGSDSTGTGSVGSPLRTIQKAADLSTTGDTVLVQEGVDGEYVSTQASGVAFRTTVSYGAKPRAFRVRHSNITIEGFQISGMTDSHLPAAQSWQGSVRVEVAGHNAVIRSNLFGPGIYAKGMGFTFSSVSNAIVNQSLDFNAAGFNPGAHIYMGASGLDGLWYTNHNREFTLLSVSADGHAMYVTNTLGATQIEADSGTNYWAVANIGNGSESVAGIFTVNSGGTACSNLVIESCTFSNLFGACIFSYANGATIVSNTFLAHGGYRTITLQGSNHLIRKNVFRRFTRPLAYLQAEIQNLVHPGGTEWFDYASSEISAFAENSVNNTIAENWFEDIHNQLGLADPFVTSYGLTYVSNVFVGVTEHFSGGRSGMRWLNNTFLRCAYDFGEGFPLALGSAGNPVYGNEMSRNLFIACGDNSGGSSGYGDLEGWWSYSTNAINPYISSNWIAGPESLGWVAKTGAPTTNGNVNGGSPLFVNLSNPMGPDGIPWTADDGVAPMPGSAVATMGIGALGAPVTSQVIPHFQIASPTNKWWDNNTTNYDTAWRALHPGVRSGPMRHYTTPDAIGTVPATLVLDLRNTFNGASNSLRGITGARIDWGDGTVNIQAGLWNSGFARHTYVTAGSNMVTVTMTNWAGSVGSMSAPYKVLPNDGSFTNRIWFVDSQAGNDSNSGTGSWAQAWATLQKVGTNALLSPGDIVAARGRFTEWTDITKAGAVGKPIRFLGFGDLGQGIGVGTINGGFRVRQPDLTFDGWYCNASNVPASDGVFRIYDIAHRLQVLNTIVTDHDPITSSNDVAGIDYEKRLGFNHVRVSGADEIGQSASSFVYSNVIATKLNNMAWSLYGSTGLLYQVEHSWCNGQADFVRPHGYRHKVLYWWTHDNSLVKEEHSDVVQAFNIAGTSSPQMAKDIILAYGIASNFVGQIGQLETMAYTTTNLATNIVLFSSILGTKDKISANINGFKLINCGFYRNPFGYPFVAVGGGTGDNDGSWGMRIFNNVFWFTGNDPTNNQTGWYTVTADSAFNRGDLIGDYNLAYPAKRTPPPTNNSQRWASFPGHEVHGLNGIDPGFVDSTNFNFRPRADSVLLLSATNMTETIAALGIPVLDLDGNPRPATGNWAIGPYELGSTNTGGESGSDAPTVLQIISTRINAGTINVQ